MQKVIVREMQAPLFAKAASAVFRSMHDGERDEGIFPFRDFSPQLFALAFKFTGKIYFNAKPVK